GGFQRRTRRAATLTVVGDAERGTVGQGAVIQARHQLPPADVGAHTPGLARRAVVREADAAAVDRCMRAAARPVAGIGGTRIAVVAALRSARVARPGPAGVVGRAGIAVLAGRAVWHRHVDARARRGIALAGLVTPIECRTHHGRTAATGAGVAGAIVLGAGARVVAGYPFVRRDAVAGARGGGADLRGGESFVPRPPSRPPGARAAPPPPHPPPPGAPHIGVSD